MVSYDKFTSITNINASVYYYIIIAKMRTIGGKGGKREYVLQSVLGQGSFGKVYYSPPFAVKEITLNLQSHMMVAIRNQTSILRQMDHPNIVKLLDVLEEGNSLFMVMEYCQMDLSQYLRKYKLDEARAIDIIRQVVAGLSCLVQRGVIHRDLKPANILVNNRGEFKLADFGLARYVQEYDSSLLQTIAGTPLYMAPQILKKTPYTTKCDIWSAGIIFYQLLVGRLPWMATNEGELIFNIANKPLQIPAILSEWSRNLLTRMIVAGENERIGWDQLFEIVRNQNTPRGKSKSNAKSETNLDRSPTKQTKESLNYPAAKLKEILLLDLQEVFDDRTVSKILKEPNYQPSNEEITKIKEVMSYYGHALKAWYLKDLPILRVGE